MIRNFVSSFIIAALISVSGAEAQAQTQADTTAITNTALDYIEGWYAGNAERMERAVHPKLAKRIVVPRKNPERSELVLTSALELVQQTERGGGTTIPAEQQKTEVQILDIYNNAASVRVDAGGWIDYMHIAKWNEEWKIVNVLWELNPDRGN